MHYTSINKESKAARKKRDGSILFISSHGEETPTNSGPDLGIY